MAEKFQIGATVKLKSGGPVMTVAGYMVLAPGVPSSTVICKWFDGTRPSKDNFHEDTLMEVDLDDESAPMPFTV